MYYFKVNYYNRQIVVFGEGGIIGVLSLDEVLHVIDNYGVEVFDNMEFTFNYGELVGVKKI